MYLYCKLRMHGVICCVCVMCYEDKSTRAGNTAREHANMLQKQFTPADIAKFQPCTGSNAIHEA